jgi:transposase
MTRTVSPNSDEQLPDNVPDCHKIIQDLRVEVDRLTKVAETVSLLQQQVSKLQSQIKDHRRARFGKSSAKVSGDSITGDGKDFYEKSKQDLEAAKADMQIPDKPKTHGGGGRSAPGNAPTERTVKHRITDEEKLRCPCCGTRREEIGFETSYQLDVIKTVLERLQHIQFKYCCSNCKGQILMAEKPEQLINKSYATEGLITHIGISKFDWHLPLYRQERIFRAQSVPIARSTMCRWLKNAADYLNLIVELMFERILDSRLIQSDHTPMPVIKKGLGKTHRGYIWIYGGSDENPYTCYEFTETQHGEHPVRRLPGFKGVFQTDGAQYFNGVSDNGAIRAGCWAHAFRKFEAARDNHRELADYGIAVIKSLFDIEREAADLDENERKELRQRLAKPTLDRFESWLHLQKQRTDILPEEEIGKAIGYCLNQWDALYYYADTGFVPADNNSSENGLRPTVLGKNNWLFAGSVDGGKTGAVWMSIIQTCHRLEIDPFEYIKDVLTRLPSTPTSQIDQFLPDRWKADRENET